MGGPSSPSTCVLLASIVLMHKSPLRADPFRAMYTGCITQQREG
jgi:hypothetical protein